MISKIKHIWTIPACELYKLFNIPLKKQTQVINTIRHFDLRQKISELRVIVCIGEVIVF